MALNTRWMSYLGVAAAALAWVIILTAVYLNPWFVFTRNAFSDLGGPRASDPWVYNYGLMAVASLMTLFSAYAGYAAESKVHVAASSLLGVAGVFLALIGYFHEGTYPHVFVSQWFFVQADLAIIFWGAGTLATGLSRARGLAELLIGLLGPIPALVVRWPSAATLEAYGIVLIDLAVGLVTIDLLLLAPSRSA